tara:strand:+ start:2500 stop:2838 length:339 start_codon:yes stop_codon:yes gene_type:complete
MKDATMPPPSERKKIMFYDSPDKQTRFRIRCQHDGLSQSQFFRLVLRGYIEDDPLVLQFLNNCKEKYSIQGKSKMNKIERFKKAAEENKNKFSLKEEEIESIYDLLEGDGEI